MDQSDGLNRRSYDTGGFLGVFKRTIRIIPAFVAAATASCAVGYYGFHIPPERLGVIAGVPCVLGFVVIRILALILPAKSTMDPQQPRPSAFFRVVVLLSVVAALTATDFIFTAFVYYALAESRLMVLGAFRIAALSAALAVTVILVAFFSKVPELWITVFAAAVKVLRTQTELTRAVFSPPKHWSR
jgi:hypothetical protein